jgi:excisionase family DNA binding protein
MGGEMKDLGRKRIYRDLQPELKRAVMTLREAAEYLKCHQTTMYRLIKRGELPAFRVGADWHLRRADFEEWIAQQERLLSPQKTGPEPPRRTAVSWHATSRTRLNRSV